MATKKKNSIESLVDSILLQQRQCWNHGDVDICDERPLQPQQQQQRRQKPYTLLLQHTQSFMARYDHSNMHQQISQQPWLLQSGELWMEYIANLVLQQQQQHPTLIQHPTSKLTVATATPSPSHGSRRKLNSSRTIGNDNIIIFLTTLPITSTSALKRLQSKYGTDRVQNISCGRLGTFTDFDTNNNNNNNNNNNKNTESSRDQSPLDFDLERLDTIVGAVKDRVSISSSTTSAIFIDSITPIFIRHGYTKLIQFVQRLIDVCSSNNNQMKLLMILPVRIEMFTSIQHTTFENTIGSDAILNLIPTLPHDFTLTNETQLPHMALFVRRGVSLDRRDYIRRDMIPYQVITIMDNDMNQRRTNHTETALATVKPSLPSPSIRRRYCIECCPIDSIPDDADVPNKSDTDSMNDASAIMSSLSLTSTNDAITVSTKPYTTSSIGTTKALPLQLDDGTRRHYSPETTSAVTTAATTKKPNIYLEENDPEFFNNDDYDEDEPDDDLDL